MFTERLQDQDRFAGNTGFGGRGGFGGGARGGFAGGFGARGGGGFGARGGFGGPRHVSSASPCLPRQVLTVSDNLRRTSLSPLPPTRLLPLPERDAVRVLVDAAAASVRRIRPSRSSTPTAEVRVLTGNCVSRIGWWLG